jgi:hypothetical protein
VTSCRSANAIVLLDTLQNMRQYLTGLTANLAKHTITDVQHEDRVSLLLKDSFIESFAPKERPFVRQFVVRCGCARWLHGNFGLPGT